MITFIDHVYDVFSHITTLRITWRSPIPNPHDLRILVSIYDSTKFKIQSKCGTCYFMYFESYEQAEEVLNYIKTNYILWI